MARHFLYITNSRLVSLVVHGGALEARAEFPVTGQGLADFGGHVDGLRKVPTRLITDLAEEDFRLDTIPHVGGGDRDAIVNRKLGQIFRNTPFRYAQPQGREAEGRRDDRVMYTAVTNAEVLKPWVEVLSRREVPLEGIHSSAVMSAALLTALAIEAPNAVLVTFTPGEAMRQSYFRDREIRFSRLSPVDLQPGQSLGAMVAEETTRTWQYLDSLRHFGPQDPLDVLVLLHPSEIPAVQAELHSVAQMRYTLLDIHAVAARLGMKPPPRTSTAEEVLVHLFLKHPAPNHFATPEMRRFATLRSTRRLLVQAACAILAAGIGWGAFNLLRAQRVDEADQGQLRQLAAIGAEADEVRKTTPSLESSGATMRDAVQFYNGSIRAFPSIGVFLRDISQVVAAHPEVRLAQVAWRASDNDKGNPLLVPTPTRDALPVKSVGKAQEALQTLDDPNPPFAGGRVEVALLEATLAVRGNDFRAATAQAEKFAADFAALPGTRADLVEAPLDLRPTYTLRGRHTELEPGEAPARFVVRVVREKAAGG